MNVKLLDIGYMANNRYTVVGILGSGQAGHVYRVKDKQGGRDKAMKSMNTDRAGNNDYRCEVSMLRALSGLEGVPPLYDEFTEIELNFLVTDIYHKDLWRFLQNNPNGGLSMEQVLTLSYHFFGIINLIHNKKVIHRDVKLANMALKLYHKKAIVPIVFFDYGMSIRVVDDAPPSRDHTYSQCKYVTPSMLDGNLCTKNDDCNMLLYCILELIGPDIFGVYDGSSREAVYEKKKAFMANPMTFQNDQWIGELCTEINSKKGNEIQNYSRLRSIVKYAKRGFHPHKNTLSLQKTSTGRYFL